MSRPRYSLIGVVAVVATLGLSLWWAYSSDNRQRELIDSGQCRAVTEVFYQPPPTYICTSYLSGRSSAICAVQTPVVSSPYLRTLWACEGGEEFWRKSE